MPLADELVTILGVKIAADAMGKLKTFSDGIASISKSVAGIGVVVMGAATAAGLFINKTVNEASELEKLSLKTKMSTTEIQEWQYAASRSGLDAKALTNDLVSLQKTMSSPIPGQYNANMVMLGVSARDSSGKLKTTDKLLEGMADKFKAMSTQRAAQWGSKMGLSDDTVALLRKGKEGIEQLRKEAHRLGGIIPEDAIKRGAEFKRNLAELQFALRGLTAQVALATLPALTKIMDRFKEWIAVNKEWVSLGLEAVMLGLVQGFEQFFNAISKVADFFEPLIDSISGFLPEMENAELVTHFVTGALTGLLIIFAPLLAKIALAVGAVMLLAAVFNDLFMFLDGGDSVIGGLFESFKKEWPELYDALATLFNWLSEKIEPAFMAVWEGVKYVASGFGELGSAAFDVFNKIAGPIKEFFQGFEEKFPALYAGLQSLAAFVGGNLKGAFDILIAAAKMFIGIIGEVLGVIGTVIEAGAGLLDKFLGDEDTVTLVAGAQSATTQASATTRGLAAAGGAATGQANAAGTTINDNKEVTIMVSTSDPTQAAQMTADALNSNNVNTPGNFAPVAQ